MKEEIVDGVRITTDDDGNQHFEILDDDLQTNVTDNRSCWQKFKDSLSKYKIKLYAKIRDLADPFNDRDDFDAGSDGKSGIEIGIKIGF